MLDSAGHIKTAAAETWTEFRASAPVSKPSYLAGLLRRHAAAEEGCRGEVAAVAGVCSAHPRTFDKSWAQGLAAVRFFEPRSMFLASNICWVSSGTCHYKAPDTLPLHPRRKSRTTLRVGDGQGSVLLRPAGGQRREARHEEVQACSRGVARNNGLQVKPCRIASNLGWTHQGGVGSEGVGSRSQGELKQRGASAKCGSNNFAFKATWERHQVHSNLAQVTIQPHCQTRFRVTGQQHNKRSRKNP